MRLCFLLLSCLMFIKTGFTQANYDENKVPEYTLPVLLKSEEGLNIENVKDWENVRRPEILKLFKEHMFGDFSGVDIKTRFEVKNIDKNALNGKAIRISLYILAQIWERSPWSFLSIFQKIMLKLCLYFWE